MKDRKRDTLIDFQRFTATTDEYGEEVKVWAKIGDAYADVFYGRGDEKRQAAREQGTQAANFVVPSNSMTRGINIADRIVLETDNWDIVGTSPTGIDDIEFTAKRVVP
jgi:head-tail adaptor